MRTDPKIILSSYLDLVNKARELRRSLDEVEARVINELEPGAYLIGNTLVEIREGCPPSKRYPHGKKAVVSVREVTQVGEPR